MKYNIFKKALFLVALTLVVSCQDDDSLEDVRNKKPVLTLDTTSINLDEGESTTITVTIDEPYAYDIDFKLDISDAQESYYDISTSGEENSLAEGGFGQGTHGFKFVFPAYATSFQISIKALVDLKTEGTENLQLFFRSSGNGLGLINPDTEYVNLTINDVVGSLGFNLNWSTYKDLFGATHDYTYNGLNANLIVTEYSYSEYDYDLYFFDSGFNEVSGFAGATSRAPEEFFVGNNTLADGEYYVVIDLYDSATYGPIERFRFDVQLTVSKLGVWSQTLSFDDYYSDSANSYPSGLSGGEIIAAIITKSGDVFTLSDIDNNILAQGKMANLKNKVSQIKANKQASVKL